MKQRETITNKEIKLRKTKIEKVEEEKFYKVKWKKKRLNFANKKKKRECLYKTEWRK